MTAKQSILGSTTLPLSELRIDEKSNVRKIGRGAGVDMIASIKALGIQMPLIVRKNGKGYVVTDGGKRFEAAEALVKSGDLAADAPIPVIVSTASDAEARELSLALNLVRSDMHPVDAFRAFAALHSANAVALGELGVDADLLLLVMAKGEGPRGVLVDLAVAPGVEDRIVERAQGEPLVDDLLADAEADGDRVHVERLFLVGHYIKQELKAGGKVGAALAEIGLEAYEARGGKITRDLFGDDHTVSDEALLRAMVAEIFQSKIEALRSSGWAWVLDKRPDDYYRYGQIEIEANWSKEQRAEAKRLKAIMEGDPRDADEQSEASAAAEAAIDALEETVALASYSDKQKARAGCFVYRDYDGAIKIEHGKIRPEDRKEAAKAKRSEGDSRAAASVAKAKITKATVLTNALRDRLTEQREAAIKAALITDTEKRDPLAKMLASIVSAQINPGRYNAAPDPVRSKFDAIASTITPKVMNAALRKAFDAKGYFEGCGKAFCVAALTEAVNADEARKASSMKKGELAKFALTNVGKTGWLPKELRTAHYDGQKGKAKPAPKAKKTKK